MLDGRIKRVVGVLSTDSAGAAATVRETKRHPDSDVFCAAIERTQSGTERAPEGAVALRTPAGTSRAKQGKTSHSTGRYFASLFLTDLCREILFVDDIGCERGTRPVVGFQSAGRVVFTLKDGLEELSEILQERID